MPRPRILALAATIVGLAMLSSPRTGMGAATVTTCDEEVGDPPNVCYFQFDCGEIAEHSGCYYCPGVGYLQFNCLTFPHTLEGGCDMNGCRMT